MRYVVARLKTERREAAYRFYLTDGLYAISNTLSQYVGGGSHLQITYRDLIDETPKDERTVEEIVGEVFAGITGEQNESV